MADDLGMAGVGDLMALVHFAIDDGGGVTVMVDGDRDGEISDRIARYAAMKRIGLGELCQRVQFPVNQRDKRDRRDIAAIVGRGIRGKL